ncbi:S8 family serine peptidase [Rubrobacter marinus]|uniref:S8 family serine peptidase n=1 Tax=Rubrobacter marinus TaxID=2653852 RepID=A0A6G8PT84_9ACTN|nr:S8 family serine peptidase [Rubrobacter marinus]QIN77718.1 S8 family serine peptidase [Rubrobacter marinus]
MTNSRRQMWMVLIALIGAVLLLLGPTVQAQDRDAPSDEGSSGKKPALPEDRARELEEKAAERAREREGDGPLDLRVDEDPEGNRIIRGELTIDYEERASAAAEDAVLRRVEARTEEELPEIDAEVVSFPEIKNERDREAREEALERKKRTLEGDPSVESVSYSYVQEPMQAEPQRSFNDPMFGQQWGLPRIRANGAWDTATGTSPTRGPSVIAVIDSGIHNDHPDITSSSIADEWDYLGNDPVAQEDLGHGTHVAGIAAALTNNGTGISGTSPDAVLFDYKVCGIVGGEASCPNPATNAAIIDAANFGADVINLSLGGPGHDPAQQQAIDYAWSKGVVVVASAGNFFMSGNPVMYPAAYPNAMAVGATNRSNVKSDFSEVHPYVDVAAPGGQRNLPSEAEQILSSVLPHCIMCDHPNPEREYVGWPGTSMAAPFVAGLAANLAGQDLLASEIRRRIEATATDLGAAGKDSAYGWGLINAHAAVTEDTRPWVKYPAPAQSAVTYDRTPTIGANVGDAQGRLARSGVQMFVDGRKITTFSYTSLSSTTGRVGYTPSLAPGFHKVRIYATDPQGMTTSGGWGFTVK